MSRLDPMRFRTLCAVLILVMLVTEGFGQIYLYRKYGKNNARDQVKSTVLFKAPPIVNYKGLEFSGVKPKGTYRVVILGGSAAAGFGTNIKKSWWFILRNRMLQDPALAKYQDIEFINMAQGGNTSIEDYLYLVKDAAPLNPDLVVVYSGWNDLAALMGNPGWITQNTQSLLSQLNMDMAHHRPSVWIRKHLFLGRKFLQVKEELEESISLLYASREALRNRILTYLQSKSLWDFEIFRSVLPSSSSGDDEVTFQKILTEEKVEANYFSFYKNFSDDFKRVYRAYFKTNLSLIAQELQRQNIKGVFIYQPNFTVESFKREFTEEETAVSRKLLGSKADDWRIILKDNYDEGALIMEKIALKHELHYIKMQDLLAGDNAKEIFLDEVHYTEEGNRQIADALYAPILSMAESELRS